MPGPESLGAKPGHEEIYPVAICPRKSICGTLVPGVKVFAIVENDLGIGIGGNELGCENRARGVGYGDAVAEQSVKVGCCDFDIAV